MLESLLENLVTYPLEQLFKVNAASSAPINEITTEPPRPHGHSCGNHLSRLVWNGDSKFPRVEHKAAAF